MQIEELREKFDLKSDKQAMFCVEYLADLNGTQAAIRAGYNKNTARQQASQNLSKLNFQEAIQYLKKERGRRIEIDQDFVLKGLKNVFGRCLQAIPVTDKKGTLTGEFRFNPREANRSLELIGRHLGMFTDKIKYEGEVQQKVVKVDLSKMSEEEVDEILKQVDMSKRIEMYAEKLKEIEDALSES